MPRSNQTSLPLSDSAKVSALDDLSAFVELGALRPVSDKPQRKAVMDSLIKIPPPPAKKTRKGTMALLVARCLAEVKIDRALRQDSCRASCGECLRKHLGSAIVCAHEVAHGYPHHDLLVIGHLSEAEQESARDNPGLAEGIRSLRRKFQHGGGLDFDDVVELLQGSMDNPWTQQAYG